MLTVKDKSGKLIAMIVNIDSNNEKKQFFTNSEDDVQFGVFSLEEREIIENHYHPTKKRIITTTSEVLVVLEGEIEVNLFDDNLDLISSHIIKKGNVLITFSGGHGLKVAKKTKLLEIKQGPYDEKTDKIRFW